MIVARRKKKSKKKIKTKNADQNIEEKTVTGDKEQIQSKTEEKAPKKVAQVHQKNDEDVEEKNPAIEVNTGAKTVLEAPQTINTVQPADEKQVTVKAENVPDTKEDVREATPKLESEVKEQKIELKANEYAILPTVKSVDQSTPTVSVIPVEVEPVAIALTDREDGGQVIGLDSIQVVKSSTIQALNPPQLQAVAPVVYVRSLGFEESALQTPHRKKQLDVAEAKKEFKEAEVKKAVVSPKVEVVKVEAKPAVITLEAKASVGIVDAKMAVVNKPPVEIEDTKVIAAPIVAITRQPSVNTLKDQKLWRKNKHNRLHSDQLAQALVTKLQREVDASRRRFEIGSQVDNKAEFFNLVECFCISSQEIQSQRNLVSSSCDSMTQQLESLWHRDPRQITKKLVTGEGTPITHTHKYVVMALDTKELKGTIQSVQGLYSGFAKQITNLRHSQRYAFLRVELHLHNLDQDFQCGDKPSAKAHLRCLDVLFYFLNGRIDPPEGEGKEEGEAKSKGLKVRKCLRKWIQIVTSRIYAHGSLQEQEYVFQHAIRSQGIGSWGRNLARFPANVESWGSKGSWHFLRLLTLLVTPLTIKPEEDEKGNKEIKEAEDWVMIGPQTPAPQEPKMVLKEADFVAILSDFPIKQVVQHLMGYAFNAYAKKEKEGKVELSVVRHAFANLKALVNTIATALSTPLQLCKQFSKYLCQTLCWITHCLVDTYHNMEGALDLPIVKDAKNPSLGPFHGLVQSELDWLCIRAIAHVNNSPAVGSRFFLAEFPLRYLSAKATSMAFLVIFQGIAAKALKDSAYYTLPLTYDAWQQATTTRADIRTTFYNNLRNDSDFNYLLLAMTTLATKQQEGSEIPWIWMEELFRMSFVEKSTRQRVSAVARPLMTSLCGAHPVVVSQFIEAIVRLDDNDIDQENLAQDLRLIISGFHLSKFQLTLRDLENLRSLFETNAHNFKNKLARRILSRLHHPSPALGDQADATSTPFTVERALVQMLTESHIHHLLKKTSSPADTNWFSLALTKIPTHALDGRALGPVLSTLPSNSFLARNGIDNSDVDYILSKDPIVTYAELVLTSMGKDSNSICKGEGFERLVWLLQQPEPHCFLGYVALYALLPALARDLVGKDRKMPELVYGLIDGQRPRGLGAVFRRDTETFTITKGLQNILTAHVAGLVIQPHLISSLEGDVKERKHVSQPPIQGKILTLWLNQISMAAPKGHGPPLLLWLKDHNCRILFNGAVRSLHILQPVDKYDRLTEMSSFLSGQIKGYISHSPVSEKLTPCVLSAFQPKLMVKYAWLTFQVLVETTLIDRPKWILIGHEVVNRGFSQTLKKILRSIAPQKNVNKLLLWESMIREWLRHAIELEIDNPLQLIYWQGFFHLYFAKIYDTRAPGDNPNGFYGFRWLCGKSGGLLHSKALQRLDQLEKHYRTVEVNSNENHPKGSNLAPVFHAMRLWLLQNPSLLARSSFASQVPPAGHSEKIRNLLISACPKRNPEAAIGWYLNQLYIRASSGILPEEYAPALLSSVILEDPLTRNRQYLWLSFLPIHSLKESEMRRSQQYIPREVYTKVFLNKESKNLLAPAMEPLRIPAASPDGLSRQHSQTRKKRLLSADGNNLLSKSRVQSHDLSIPPVLREPPWKLLGDDVLQRVVNTFNVKSKTFQTRLSRLLALNTQVEASMRFLWKNEAKTTRIKRQAKRSLFSKAEVSTVTFRFDHTEPVRVESVSKSLKQNRDQAFDVCLSSPEVSADMDKIEEDITAMVIVVEQVQTYLNHHSKSLSSKDEARSKLLCEYANNWLYTLIEQDSTPIRLFPPTRPLIPTLVEHLLPFVQTDFKSQMRVVKVLQVHPQLTESLVSGLQPLCLYFKPNTHIANHSGLTYHQQFLKLFENASRVLLVLGGERTGLCNPKCLDRFPIESWLSGRLEGKALPAGIGLPESLELLSLLDMVLNLLQEQSVKKPPPSLADHKRTFQVAKKQCVSILVSHIKACLLTRLEQTYPKILSSLLERCVTYPVSIPVELWDAINNVPLQRLSWDQLLNSMRKIQFRFESLRAENLDAKVSRSIYSRIAIGDAKPTASNERNDSISGLMRLVKGLVVAALRRIYLLKANIQNENQLRIEEHVLRREMELWNGLVGVFRPFLSSYANNVRDARVRPPWLLDQDSSPLIHKVVFSFFQCVYIVALPAKAIFEGKQGDNKFATWESSLVLKQLWDFYLNHISIGPIYVLIKFQTLFSSDSLHPTDPNVPTMLPLSQFKLTIEIFTSLETTLQGFYGDPTGEGRLKAVEIGRFFSDVILQSASIPAIIEEKKKSSHMGDSTDWKLSQDRKQENLRSPYCKSIDVIVMAAHLALICPTPYPSPLQNLLKKLLGLDYQGISIEMYETLLIKISDLLYQSPGAVIFGSNEFKKLTPTPSQQDEMNSMPTQSGERAGFVLRLVLAMAQPHSHLHDSSTIQPGLEKLRMYTEWLLSTFHQDGPKAIAKMDQYARLAVHGVIFHINNNYASIKMNCQKGTLVELLEEITLLTSNATRAQTRDPAHHIANTLFLRCPALACEAITACCNTLSSEPLPLSASIEETLASVIAVGSRTFEVNFRWDIAAHSLRDFEGIQTLKDACVRNGKLLALNLLSVQSMLTSAPDLCSKRANISPEQVLRAQAHVHSLITSLERAEASAQSARGNEEIRALEHKLIILCRTIVHVQSALVKVGASDLDGKHKAADNSFGAFLAYLEMVSSDSKFSRSAFGRFSGRLLGVVGIGRSQYTKRFRVATRALATFISMRRATSSEFQWQGPGLHKDHKKISASFRSLEKNRKYDNLKSKICSISSKLHSPGFLLIDVGNFFEENILGLFPDLKWPPNWIKI